MGGPVVEGEVLAGKYRVERVIGQGGMGVVLSATHLQLHQRVAIKLLLADATPDAVERFLREARASVRLKSEHVARVLDVGTLETGAPYMVMEFLQGQDLSHLLHQRGPLPIEEAVEYVLHACEAIAEAHAAGIIHRDLKPANLFLTSAADGTRTVKVLDFGISKAIAEPQQESSEPEMALTKTAMVLGSPLYMAPEQMRSARTVDARADMWSLGAILYQLLAGRVPFQTTSLTELVLMINGEPPPPPSAFRPDLPAPLTTAILRCLEKRREDRFAHVGELAEAIAPFGPPDAAGSVVRIHRMLGTPAASMRSAPSLPAIVPGAMTAPDAVRPSVPMPTLTPAVSSPGWSASTTERPRRSGAMLAIVGAGIALVLGGVAAVAVYRLRAPEDVSAAAPSAEPTQEPAPPVAPAPPTAEPVVAPVTAQSTAELAPTAAPSAAPVVPTSAPRATTAPPPASRATATATATATAPPEDPFARLKNKGLQ